MSNFSEPVDQLEIFFEDTIQKMERQFTSHEFFLKLLHEHQSEYIAALGYYTKGGKPFQKLHWELVKRLRKLEGKLIALQEKDFPSRDIFGIASTTTLWRKK